MPAFESEDVTEEVTVEKVRALGSGMVTARVGMRRMVVSQAAFTRVAVPREADDLAARVSAIADGVVLGVGGEAWDGDT